MRIELVNRGFHAFKKAKPSPAKPAEVAKRRTSPAAPRTATSKPAPLSKVSKPAVVKFSALQGLTFDAIVDAYLQHYPAKAAS